MTLLLGILSPIAGVLAYAAESGVSGDDPDDPTAGWRRLALWLALFALVAYAIREGVVGSLVDAFASGIASAGKALAGLVRLVGVG